MPLMPETLRALITGGRMLQVKKGQIFQTTDQESRVFYLRSGYVKRYLIKSDGSLGVQNIYGEGDVFPITFAYRYLLDINLNNDNETYYYEAMEKSIMFYIKATDLVAATEKDPLLYKDLFIVSGNRLRADIHHLENMTLPIVYKRLCHMLLHFAQDYGVKIKEGTKIPLTLTQQDLADFLNATRETVSIAMTKLKQQKIVLDKRNLIIISVEKLTAEIYE